MQERVRRATAWLRVAKPITVEDRAFRLLGLTWGGAEADVRREAAKELVALQRADGGWSQRAELQTDAYATGLAIYALKESGSELPSAAGDRASQYLRSTQRADGSWYVRSRSAEVPAVLRRRFPLRARSVDFVDGDRVGDCGAGAERELEAGPKRPGLRML